MHDPKGSKFSTGHHHGKKEANVCTAQMKNTTTASEKEKESADIATLRAAPPPHLDANLAEPQVEDNDSADAQRQVARPTRNGNDNTRPGAVRVFPGTNNRNHEQQEHGSRLQSLSDGDEVYPTNTTATTPTNTAREPSSPQIVAEVVGEEQILREVRDLLLSRQANSTANEASFVPFENVVVTAVPEVVMDITPDKNDTETHHGGLSRVSKAFILLILVVIVVIVVTIAVVVTNNRSSPSSNNEAPSPAPVDPLAQALRLEDFRSVLLNHSVSSAENLYNENTPQYQALNWLAVNDPAKLNVTQTTAPTIFIHRYVLAVLYFSTKGVNWIDQRNFLSAESVCQWHNSAFDGAFCSSANELQSLVLQENCLSGTIPSELGSLSSLEKLDFSYSEITETLPTELGSLTKLTSLVLDYNLMTGTIPTELGRLSILTTLSLYRNALTGTVPTALGALSNLDILYLDQNNVTGNLTAIFCIPDGSSNITKFESDCNSKVECGCCTECF